MLALIILISVRGTFVGRERGRPSSARPVCSAFATAYSTAQLQKLFDQPCVRRTVYFPTASSAPLLSGVLERSHEAISAVTASHLNGSRSTSAKWTIASLQAPGCAAFVSGRSMRRITFARAGCDKGVRLPPVKLHRLSLLLLPGPMFPPTPHHGEGHCRASLLGTQRLYDGNTEAYLLEGRVCL